MKTIVLSGGGSGGHITPLLAVANELKKIDPQLKLVYIGQKGDILGDITQNAAQFDEVYSVSAGKFRRYHGEGIKQLLDLPTLYKNFIDFFKVIFGVVQSYRLLSKINPDLIFTRGGFVSVPICLAAGYHHIPYITHDSDSIPSLANRIVARRALIHAVALPKEVYPYPQIKTVTTGIPINENFKSVTQKLKNEYRQDLNIGVNNQVLLITGGGLGADLINNTIVGISSELLKHYPNLIILHIAGTKHAEELDKKYTQIIGAGDRHRIIVKSFIEDLYRYSGAADLIIARAGATTLAEFAVQGKACIAIPNPALTGGHQLKNAEAYAKHGAIEVYSEENLADQKSFLEKIVSLLDDSNYRAALASNIQKL